MRSAAWIGLGILGFVRAITGRAADAASGGDVEPVAASASDSGAAAASDSLEPGSVPSLWDGSVTLRAWSGYRDNPQLSAVNPVGSAYVAAGGEAMGFRLPIDGWEASFFGLFERLEYLESGLSPETTGVLDARGKRTWGAGWQVGAAVEYYYLRQVFDASEIVGVRVIIPAEGHTLAFRPSLGREFGKGWRWEVEPEFSRQWLGDPLDSFLDVGTRVQAVNKLGRGSEVGVSYRFRDRAFDERVPRDSDGDALSGSLRYTQHEGETFWRAVWDEKRRWRTTLRGGYLGSDDNGGGYFDYQRWQVGGQLRYSHDRWEVRAEAKSRWYRYPVQKASLPAGPLRRRMDVNFLFRGDWKLGGGWRLFGQYEFEMSDENTTATDYRSTGVSVGVEWEK